MNHSKAFPSAHHVDTSSSGDTTLLILNPGTGWK